MSVVYKLTCVLYLLLSAFNSYAYSQQKVFISNIEASEDVNNRITSSEWSALNEELKIVIGRNIKSNTNKEYTLISAENISELLPPETRLEDCVGECIVKVGRLVQAHITVHGSLKWINKRYYLYLTATKTSSGEVLESERIAFKDFGEAFDKISKINLMHAAKSLEKNAQVTKRMKTLPESKPVNGNASYLLSNLRGGGSKRSSSSPILDLGASLGKKRPKKPSKNDIRKAMRRVNVDRCAEVGVLEGKAFVKIYVKIRIASNGSVRSAEAHGPFKSTSIGKCLENEVRKQRVPPFSNSNISFKFPFKVRLKKSSLDVKGSISCPPGMVVKTLKRFPKGSIDKGRISGKKAVIMAKAGHAYCIDTHEYPGRGQRPKVNVNFAGAQSLCAQVNKRLCTGKEWRQACGSSFPYGKSFNSRKCNTEDAEGEERKIAAAGSFKRCRRGGVYDMSGNVSEWTSDERVRGGYYASYDDEAACSGGGRRALFTKRSYIGFRCCADLK